MSFACLAGYFYCKQAATLNVRWKFRLFWQSDELFMCFFLSYLEEAAETVSQ